MTTVYPTSATGTYEHNGNKSTKEDVFPSGKGRKCLSCQRIDIMPILALSCYFLCIQFHIVLQIYFSCDLNDNTTILRSVLKTSTHLQILIFLTVRPIGICQYYNCLISLAITATSFAFVSILMVPSA